MPCAQIRHALYELLIALEEADTMFAGKSNIHTFTLQEIYENFVNVRNIATNARDLL